MASSVFLSPLAPRRHTGAFLLLASLCGLGCDGWTWGDDAPSPPSNGSLLTLKVLSARDCAPAGAPPPGVGTPSRRTLGVDIELTGWDPMGIPANYYYAHLEDPQGRHYPAEDGCEPAFVGPPLRPGERAQGLLTFSVPAAVSAYKLVYAPRLVDPSAQGDKARVEVAVGDGD